MRQFIPAQDARCDLLFRGERAQRSRNRAYQEGPIEVLPGIWSNEPNFLLFKDLLSRELSRRFTPNVDQMGRVTGNGVRSNFFGMRHINGYPAYPATYPLVENAYLREEKGLSNSFVEPWHETVLECLIDLLFTDLEPLPMKVRKGSSSMIPWFTNVMSQKLDLARFSQRHAVDAFALIQKGEYESAFEQYFIGGAYNTVYRSQSTDQVSYEKGVFTSKPRPVADLEFALSGGKKGTFEAPSREMHSVDFASPPGFFRERLRTAMGGPWGLNSVLMPHAQSVRHKMYTEYAYTFHHTSRLEKQRKFREQRFTINMDVSNHDWFWGSKLMLPVFQRRLEALGYPEWFVHFYMLKSTMPNYVTAPGPDLDNGLLGDWRDPTYYGGLNSGNVYTDIEGSIGMVFVYLVAQLEHTARELIPMFSRSKESCTQAVDAYLRGSLDISIFDKSDDASLNWKTPHGQSRAEAFLRRMQTDDSFQPSPYMIIENQHGGAFLGDLLLFPTTGNIKEVTLIGDIQSMLVNEFSPEYGVQSAIRDRTRVRRPFPGLAWASIPDAYGSSPIYQDVRDIIERIWQQVYGYSYNGMRDKLLTEDETNLRKFTRSFANIGVPDLTDIDLEVLLKPERLQYKYEPDDVSPDIVDLLFNGLPLEEVEPYFNSIMKDVSHVY